MTAYSNIGETAEQTPDAWLHEAFRAYAATSMPIAVNFRELVPNIRTGAERATHLIHPYPAKLLASIPSFFLSCKSLAPPGTRILDPFCGSGTVLLEAALAGFEADGADSNPLARLIAAAKCTIVEPELLSEELDAISARSAQQAVAPDVVNIGHWYQPAVARKLAAIRAGILAIGDAEMRQFFEACLSACARRTSRADPRLSVPVRVNRSRSAFYGAKGGEALARLKRQTGNQVLATFRSIAELNIERMRKFQGLAGAASPPRLFEDARTLNSDVRYGLIITSPPYGGAQKYIRASSLSLGWLGLTPNGRLRDLERLNIGREHYAKSELAEPQLTNCSDADQFIALVRTENPLRAHIASNYLVEMRQALMETARVAATGGWLVLVSGQNLICGRPFDTPRYLEWLANDAGFVTKAVLMDDIKTRGLMTKRNRTAGMIGHEIIAVMQKQ